MHGKPLVSPADVFLCGELAVRRNRPQYNETDGNVMRPVTGIVFNLVTLAVRAVLGILGSVFKIGAASIRLPNPTGKKETDSGAGPPPPRWQ